MLDSEVFERLEITLEEIRNLSAEGVCVIVEGEKDKESLRELGIEGPIYQVPTGGKTSLNSLEELSECEEVIILTDFDRTGEELADFCRIHLEKLGVKVLYRYREKLRNFVRKAVKDIEGLSSFIRSERASQDISKFRNDFSENNSKTG